MGSKAIPYYYLCGALVALLLTYILPTWPLKIAFGWTRIALALIASAYWLNTARLFRKWTYSLVLTLVIDSVPDWCTRL